MNFGTAAEMTCNTCITPPLTSHTGRVAPPMTLRLKVKDQRWWAPPIRGQLWSHISTLLLIIIYHLKGMIQNIILEGIRYMNGIIIYCLIKN